MSQDSRLGDPSAEACAIVTPDLLSALCSLLHNLLAVLPDFTLGALQHSQLLQSLARLDLKHTHIWTNTEALLQSLARLDLKHTHIWTNAEAHVKYP